MDRRRGRKGLLVLLHVCVAHAVAGSGRTLRAQGGIDPSPDQDRQALSTGWSASLQPSGMPVIPLFEGWFRNADGTHSLCFGYHNLNTKEVLDIPVGPDNRIEPSRFEGMQPTHFDPVPGPELQYARRYWCVFTVTVPSDFGTQRVVWTLKVDGETYAAPGHLGSPNYEVDEPTHKTRAGVAPTLEFLPNGPKGRGRIGVTSGPLAAKVGEPLPLSVWVDPAPRPVSYVWWFQHQGPGQVTFSRPRSRVGAEGGQVTTDVHFGAPGHYVLRVQALEDAEEIKYQCCWTNGYVQVLVDE